MVIKLQDCPVKVRDNKQYFLVPKEASTFFFMRDLFSEQYSKADFFAEYEQREDGRHYCYYAIADDWRLAMICNSEEYARHVLQAFNTLKEDKEVLLHDYNSLRQQLLQAKEQLSSQKRKEDFLAQSTDEKALYAKLLAQAKVEARKELAALLMPSTPEPPAMEIAEDVKKGIVTISEMLPEDMSVPIEYFELNLNVGDNLFKDHHRAQAFFKKNIADRAIMTVLGVKCFDKNIAACTKIGFDASIIKEPTTRAYIELAQSNGRAQGYREGAIYNELIDKENFTLGGGADHKLGNFIVIKTPRGLQKAKELWSDVLEGRVKFI
jgi:hypothetical protein